MTCYQRCLQPILLMPLLLPFLLFPLPEVFLPPPSVSAYAFLCYLDPVSLGWAPSGSLDLHIIHLYGLFLSHVLELSRRTPGLSQEDGSH